MSDTIDCIRPIGTRTEVSTAHKVHRDKSGFRPLFDSLIGLAVAVTLFRTFAIEGYIISTGSMAPNLVGYHKRIQCPTCRFLFAFGVSHEKMVLEPEFVTCPNCGHARINVASIPPSVGDQLLVHKHAFTFKSPRRWEVVVFQNPNKPTQAYVKRLVGLPGERMQIIKGDIYVNGEIQRKNLSQQRGIRVLVYDDDYCPPETESWNSRWIAQPGWHTSGSGFKSVDLDREESASEQATTWVTYRHWIRSGGLHTTSVPLDRWPDGVEIPNAILAPLCYDPVARRLVCIGTLPSVLRDRLLSRTNDLLLTRAIWQIDEQSHLSPITDLYGYNRPLRSSAPVAIRDVMLTAQATIHGGNGQFVLQITDGDRVFSCVFDVGAGTVSLKEEDVVLAICAARLPPQMLSKSVLVEMSTFDRQIIVAVEGETVFKIPIQLPKNPYDNLGEAVRERSAQGATDNGQLTLRRPVRFGTRGLNVSVDSLKLFRDVYYTAGGGRNAIDEPFSLRDDEYYFLGDNSPVSLDSRSWPNGMVSSGMFLGKPLVVHLPSRPGKIRIGNYVSYIRIPDFSRIHYIR